MSNGGGKSSDSETVTVRYAPYLESYQKDLLGMGWNYAIAKQDLADKSPYQGYAPGDTVGKPSGTPFTPIDVDTFFLGTGMVLSDFPGAMDFFGKFVAGLDVETLLSQILNDTLSGPWVANLVAAEAALMDDDIQTNILPKFDVGMRDANAVESSSFVIGHAIIYDARQKSIAKFSSELQYRLIPVGLQRWQTHLEWNKSAAVMLYLELIRLYYQIKPGLTEFNYDMVAKDTQWPFQILEWFRTEVSSFQAATTSTGKENIPKWQQWLSGGLSMLGIGKMLFGSSSPGGII